MTKGSFELSVSIPRDGRATPLREFGHNGFTYIESREGQKFTLKFRNNTARRVLVVPSIDGLSVLDGKQATKDSRGYIIQAYSQAEIRGWRTSLEDINDFVFEKKESGKTYAEGTGNDTANCGVVAVKVFAEKEKPRPVVIREEHHHHHDHWPKGPYHPPYHPIHPEWPEVWYREVSSSDAYSTLAGEPEITNSAMPDMSSTMRCMNETVSTTAKYDGEVRKGLISTKVPNFDMGTGFGQHQKDKVTEESFERGAELATLQIFYASAKSLAEIGIDVDKKVAVNAMPQAFADGFCKAPSR